MLLADGFVFVWFGGVLLIGFVGFFVLVAAAVVNVFRRVFRNLASQNPEVPCESRPASRLCPRAECGHRNVARARYCARCGQALVEVGDIDDYG